MAGRGKKGFTYEGFAFPRLTMRKLLASNARGHSALQHLHKQLDKKKEELENDFSKIRGRLLSRAIDHQMVLDEQSLHDESCSGIARCASDCENCNRNPETSSFVNVKDKQLDEDDKIVHFEELIAKDRSFGLKPQSKRKKSGVGRAQFYLENTDAKSEHLEQQEIPKHKATACKPDTRRKVSWGGVAGVYNETDWVTKTEFSKKRHEDEQLSICSPCAEGNATGNIRVRKHSVPPYYVRSNSGSTKEALTRQGSPNFKPLTRRHTVCSRPKNESVVEKNSSEEKALCVKGRGIIKEGNTSSSALPRRRILSSESARDESVANENQRTEVKPLSEILSPIKLPPIYLQETKVIKKQGSKIESANFVNNHVKLGLSKSLDTKCSFQDLRYCRYLRIKAPDGQEYSW